MHGIFVQREDGVRSSFCMCKRVFLGVQNKDVVVRNAAPRACVCVCGHCGATAGFCTPLCHSCPSGIRVLRSAKNCRLYNSTRNNYFSVSPVGMAGCREMNVFCGWGKGKRNKNKSQNKSQQANKKNNNKKNEHNENKASNKLKHPQEAPHDTARVMEGVMGAFY